MKKLRKMEFYNIGKDKWLIDLPEYGYARLVDSNDLELEFARLQCVQPVFIDTDIFWDSKTSFLEVDDESELFSFFLRSRRNALGLTVESCAKLLGVTKKEYLEYENNKTLMTMTEFQKICNRLNPKSIDQHHEILMN
jgi:DNA-binding XRE family transcriptional regulator